MVPQMTRLLALLRAAPLDDALIAGADPADSPQLAARAHALTSPRSRIALAAGLERWVGAAQGSASRRRVLPRRALAAQNADVVRELAVLLRAANPLYARGIAMLTRLLRDGTGPAYVGEGDVLAGLLNDARAALAGQAPARSGRTHLAPPLHRSEAWDWAEARK
jgi:hypothetical protein